MNSKLSHVYGQKFANSLNTTIIMQTEGEQQEATKLLLYSSTAEACKHKHINIATILEKESNQPETTTEQLYQNNPSMFKVTNMTVTVWIMVAVTVGQSFFRTVTVNRAAQHQQRQASSLSSAAADYFDSSWVTQLNVVLEQSYQRLVEGGQSLRPLLLPEARHECQAAFQETGVYPSVSREMTQIKKQNKVWQQHSALYRLANHKLGGIYYASRLGVRTPRILHCGSTAGGGLPLDSDDLDAWKRHFGNDFVSKPLTSWSAKGVRVVANGQERMTLDQPYHNDTVLIVEELVQSPAFRNKIPPDYKFYTIDGAVELGRYINRNGKKCVAFFDPNSSNWTKVHDPQEDASTTQVCQQDSFGLSNKRNQDLMLTAVKLLASQLGGSMMRVDMFDTRDGPMLGEFTAFPANGMYFPFGGCLHSYLTIRHAVLESQREDRRNNGPLVLQEFLNQATYHQTPPDDKKYTPTQTAAAIARIQSWIPDDFEYAMPQPKTSFFGFRQKTVQDQLFPDAHAWFDMDVLQQCLKAKTAQEDYLEQVAMVPRTS